MIGDRNHTTSAQHQRRGIVHAARLMILSLCAALLLSVSFGSTSARAVTWLSKLCVGFSSCNSKGMGNAGYEAEYQVSHWGMYAGHNCTNYTAYRLIKAGIDASYLRGQGMAYQWGTVAASHGVTVDGNPKPGDIAWFGANSSSGIDASGHVAYVESVDLAAGKVRVSEDNWGGDFDWRDYYMRDITGFIHFGGNPTPPPPADADGDGIPDSSDKCPNAAGPAANNGCPYIDGRVHLATKYGPVECGRAGDKVNQHLICSLWRKGKWVSMSSPVVDWGYADTRSWVANRDGTVSKCVSVNSGNQLRCDTFTGYKWTTHTSPVTDLGYQSAVDGRVFLPTKYGPAECGRAGDDAHQSLVCSLWRKGTFHRISSPVGVWGAFDSARWIANRDGTVSRCAVTNGLLRCDTFTGYKWTTHTSPTVDLGYESASDGRTFLATKYGPAECGRAGDSNNQHLICSLWRKGKWVSMSSPAVDWGYADTRGWVANRDGTVSRCVSVNAGNQLRCDTFTGYKWTTHTSPVTDLGYKSAEDGRVFLPTKYGPAECGRAGDDAHQSLVCNLWRKGRWVSISSPLGVWGAFDSARWVANRDGSVSRCAVTNNLLRCDTFTGYKWTTHTSPAVDLGYAS